MRLSAASVVPEVDVAVACPDMVTDPDGSSAPSGGWPRVRPRATLEWVDWFNNRRLLEPIGNMRPVEFEELYFRDQGVPAMVVGLT